ncbi:uncharacterized protein LOC133839578 isoform X1 [Drosophila sulfurigaster albostrigata]|uniref:uncharacterized protein LOC133839578 isoform X1 n=1 Tax=Drosophila sulfurigaster albostrigata TaxID=89887 RepID=UPI002D219E8B|nr:uncharacterized protein LOC133839578 isoform X1 [Drosophila sulfurigaster albostrigata]
MQVKIFTLFAIVLVAQQCNAASISFGDLMGDISKIAVAGEKLRHQIENQLGSAAQSAQLDIVKPEPYNILGDALGAMGNALGDLANVITSLSVQVKMEPEARSVSTSGAAIIGELGAVSAKTIAAAADAAAPYIKKLNQALGDLANTITSLRVQDTVQPESYNLLGDALGSMGTALGDLANTITSLSVEVKMEPEARSVSTSGAAIIGELGSVSAKTIAAAADAASPYVSKLNDALGDLANTITSLNMQVDTVEPESYNLLGDALGSMGTALGDLANTITSLSVQTKMQPEARSVSTSGAAIIGELGSVSAKDIAAAADAASPYVSKLNDALGDLANTITNLSVN